MIWEFGIYLLPGIIPIAIGTSAWMNLSKTKAGGLTEFGFEVIKKMDEIGMLIDVSHFRRERILGCD